MLIAIEGIDGSGKGTQAKLLAESLRQSGRSTELLSFPRYSHTFFGSAIGKYLNGQFGSLGQVDPFLASLLYAGDRFESRAVLQSAMRVQDVVVLDRYVASNIAHQGAKVSGPQRMALIHAIYHVEHIVYGLPRPDLTVLLDIPVTQAKQLIAKKSQRDYTDKPVDMHEENDAYLQAVRDVYLECAASGGWAVVRCVDGDKIRAVEDITADIMNAVQGVTHAQRAAN